MIVWDDFAFIKLIGNLYIVNSLDLVMAAGFVSTIIFFALVILLSSFKIVNEYQRGVLFTLGKFSGIMKPGLRLVVPIVQTWQRIDVRVRTIDVPSQDCVSKDNVSIKVNAVLYYKVSDSSKAILEVEDFDYAVSQLAQTTMRNIVGEFELDEILQKREKLSENIREIVDQETDQWGIQVTNIELKHIELPDTMKRAMAQQAEAERERRARITQALGEKQAAQSFAEAAKIIGKEPAALHLRFFQTINDVAAEKNSTLVLPVPTELIDFLSRKK
jgi:regulator of protease activity HflC (stomatin/prohibitin superfamily)